MADFTDLDKEQLENLRKALERSAQTNSVKQPWQEHFDRNTSAKAQKSILAADIIQGFSGSWAASYNYGYGAGITPFIDNVRKNDSDSAPVPVRAKTTKLGRRGVPDIDFVPYNWRTNRFGSKGPSLVGHPISYEVVGPTLKSPFCDWTWDVLPGAGPNGGDELTMAGRSDGGAAVASTLLGGYGNDIPVFTMGGAAEPNGGLYVLIADDGANAGSQPVGGTPMGALPQFIDTARYEIFRVASARAGILELHPDKPLSNFFDLTLPNPRTIRAITIIKPYVARIVAIPGSGNGVGKERTFAVVSPETSASSDLYPPWDGNVLGDGSWVQGGFDFNPGGSTPSGLPGGSAYLGRQLLPIPMPLDKRLGNVHTDAGLVPGAPAAVIGNWFVMDAPATPVSSSPADAGLVMRVYNIDSQDDADLTFGTPGACLGWFPISNFSPAGALPAGLVVRRTVEVDPTTGHTYFGPGPYLDNAGGPEHTLAYSVHEPVKRLWDNAFFNIDKVESCRLQNLIDPSDVSRFEKQTSSGAGGVSQPGGASFGGPERSIFDTSTSPGAPIPGSSNPGSLLDLGFRMVLFPAKDDGIGNPIPDFDHPIDTRGELTIDPTVTEQQYVEVDYDGGIVRLSHAPNGVGGDIIPNGIIGGVGTSNPRLEVVLFASCVPYSMEESQQGTGSRVVGRSLGLDQDAYSERIVAEIDQTLTTSSGSPPYVGPSGIAPNPAEIILDRLWNGPNSGVFEITDSGADGASFGVWGYSQTRTVNNGAEDVTALGGITSLPTSISDPSLGVIGPRSVVMRREVFFAEKSAAKDFGLDNATNDTAYGSSQRAGVLRFDAAKVTPQLDGSVLVVREPPGPPGSLGFEFFQWGHLGAAPGDASGILSRNDFSTTGFFYPAAYESTLGGGVGGPTTTRGAYNSDADGPYIVFDNTNQFDYNGVLAATNQLPAPPLLKQSQLSIQQRVRLVVKFKYFDIVDSTGFIGFTGSATPAVTAPDVNNSVVAIPLAAMRLIGLRIPAGGGAFEFYTTGSAGTEQIPTIPQDLNVHYLVVETSPDLAAPVRMALYGADYNLESSYTFTDTTMMPDFNQALAFVGGTRKLSALGGRPAIRIYFASAVVRYDLALG